MGKAAGQLLKVEIEELFEHFYPWIDEQVQAYAKDIPKPIVDIIADAGVEAGLELEIALTAKYTPEHFLEEMRGLAAGSGISYNRIYSLNMFPELIKASCTILGAWGDATSDGGLRMLRALDWGVDNPMRFAPITYVYHPEEGAANGHPFLNQGFPGFIGALTAYSPQAAVCEKVWIHSNETFLEGKVGIPWHFLLRDIAQFDTSVAQATSRLQGAKRTCSIFVGVGSNTEKEARIYEYKDTSVHEFTWDTPFPGYEPSPPQHPLMKDLVYVDKHTQPSGHPCTASLLEEVHGNITASSFLNDFVSWVETGDLMLAVYDFANNVVDVAVASQNPEATPILPAYARQAIRYDMAKLFAEPKPSSQTPL